MINASMNHTDSQDLGEANPACVDNAADAPDETNNNKATGDSCTTTLLKTASSEFLCGRYDSAASKFRQVYKKMDVNCFWVAPGDLEMKNLVIVYAFASALVLQEKPKQTELDEAIKLLNKLESSNAKFPLLYYPLALAYYKQTRFKLAIDSLTKAREFIATKQAMLPFYWPAHYELIKESRRDEYIRIVQELQQQCVSPPKPDYVCKGIRCKANGYERSEIYRSEPKFTGHVLVTCTKECELEFHPVCWQKLVEEDSPPGKPKRILDKPCLASNCAGTIILVRVFQANGQLKDKLGSIADTKRQDVFYIPAGAYYDARKKIHAKDLNPTLLGRGLKRHEKLARREANYEEAETTNGQAAKSSGIKTRLNRAESESAVKPQSLAALSEGAAAAAGFASASASQSERHKSRSRTELSGALLQEDKSQAEVLGRLKKSSDDELEKETQEQQNNKKKRNRKRTKSAKGQNVEGLLNFEFKKKPEGFSTTANWNGDPESSSEEEARPQAPFHNDQLPPVLPQTETVEMGYVKEGFLNDLAKALYPDKMKSLEDDFIMSYFGKSPLFHDLFEYYGDLPSLVRSDKQKRFEMISSESGQFAFVTLKRRPSAAMASAQEYGHYANVINGQASSNDHTYSNRAASSGNATATSKSSLTTDATHIGFGSGILASSGFSAIARPTSTTGGLARSASIGGAAAASGSRRATSPLQFSSKDRFSSSGNVSEQPHRMSVSSRGQSVDSGTSFPFESSVYGATANADSEDGVYGCVTAALTMEVKQHVDRLVESILTTLVVDEEDSDEARDSLRKSIAPLIFDMDESLKEKYTRGNACVRCDAMRESLDLAAAEKTSLVLRLGEQKDDIVGVRNEKQQQQDTILKLLEQVNTLKGTLITQETAKTKAANDYAQLSERFSKLNAQFSELQNGTTSSDHLLRDANMQLENLKSGYAHQQRQLNDTNYMMLKSLLEGAMARHKESYLAACARAQANAKWANDIAGFLARVGAKPQEVQQFSVCHNAWTAYLNVYLANHAKGLEGFFSQKLAEISQNHTPITYDMLSRALEQLPAFPREPDVLPIGALTNVTIPSNVARAGCIEVASPLKTVGSSGFGNPVTHATGEASFIPPAFQQQPSANSPLSSASDASFATASSSQTAPAATASKQQSAATTLPPTVSQQRLPNSRASTATSTPVVGAPPKAAAQPLTQVQNHAKNANATSHNSSAAAAAGTRQPTPSSNAKTQTAAAATAGESAGVSKLDRFVNLVRAKLAPEVLRYITRDDIVEGLRTVRVAAGGQLNRLEPKVVVDECAKLMMVSASEKAAGRNSSSLAKAANAGGGRMGLDQFSPAPHHAEAENNCPVCLEPLDSKPTVQTECQHFFHEECMRDWNKQERSCPMCRGLTLPQDEFPSLS